jgi:hypothetical protein
MSMVRQQLMDLVALRDALPAFDGRIAAMVLADIAAANSIPPRRRRIAVPAALRDAGTIDQDQFRAANEIEAVFSFISRAAAGRTASYDPERHGPTEAVPVVVRDAYSARYRPWRAQQGIIPVYGTATVADIVIQVVVDNMGLRQIADRYWMDQRSAKRIVGDGLRAYCVIAGWS